MEPTHLSEDERVFLTVIMTTYKDGPLSDTRARLQELIDRHTPKILCGSRFPFTGLQGGCDRPVGHDMGTHRWTRPVDGWQVFWDEWK